MRKKEMLAKIKQFTLLMEEISDEIESIVVGHREDEYKDLIIEMLKSLDKAQQVVKRAYHLFYNRQYDPYL